MKIYNIVFYLPSKEERSEPYISEKTYERHRDFMSYFPDNVTFYIATQKQHYIWEEYFIPHFINSQNTWLPHNGEKIEADLILWMTQNIDASRIYHNPIREICKDKRVIENLFPHHTFSSYECKSYWEVVQKFWKSWTQIQVLKPLFLSQWEGIFIGKKIPKEEHMQGMYPYLLQEFLDTSDGFEWYSGVHDFRIIIINGIITGAFLRIAPKDSLKANVKLGAAIIDIWVNNIPNYIQEVINEVEEYCKKEYPQRYYSIDFWVWKNKEVKIFELNSSPALSTQSIRKWLAQHIIKNILKIA